MRSRSPGLQGPPGPPGPGAIPIDISITNGTYFERSFPIGSSPAALALGFFCTGAPGDRRFQVFLPVGSGGFQISALVSKDDLGAIGHTRSMPLPSFGASIEIGNTSPFTGVTTGHYYRMGGTIVVHGTGGVTTMMFDMFLDDRSSAGTCHFRGTAIPAR